MKNDSTTELTFKYPKQKIFVGGLDFKLTVEELRAHFCQFGDVVDAVILKDIYTGQSRGFGFVTFKDEDVAQNLVKNIQSTTINGRKVDIKKSEPKLKDNTFLQSKSGMPFSGMPAIIPPYGQIVKQDSSRSPSEESKKSSRHRDERHSRHGKKHRRRRSSSSRKERRHKRQRHRHDSREKKRRTSRSRGDERRHR
mmetsp:Transcript_21311/g.20454  ORF Transcript_21311/g.20454 Transcript_21311/m.20454 type:complete len:196 (-) Transcript_21311:41-628(-)